MDANQTDQLSEEQKRYIRAGYYRTHKKPLDDKTLNTLTDNEIGGYLHYGKESLNRDRIREFVATSTSVIFYVVIIGFIGWTILAEDNDSSNSYQNKERCSSNYTSCIEPYPPDLDCADIGMSVRVVGSDPHGFDGDDDGYGCESY